jgi:hypothetical protein
VLIISKKDFVSDPVGPIDALGFMSSMTYGKVFSLEFANVCWSKREAFLRWGATYQWADKNKQYCSNVFAH